MRYDELVRKVYKDVLGILGTYISGRFVLRPEIPELAELFQEVQKCLNNLNAPIRVAIAGYVKAGKSTFLNALLREKLTITDGLEATLIPTWFQYGKEPGITIHFKDGSSRRSTFEERSRWTAAGGQQTDLSQVQYVSIEYPAEILRRIEFIDTPGLFSPADTDASSRTVDFLGLESTNAQQTALADAVLYAFSNNFSEEDLNTVASFTSTPINAVGIFTKPDIPYWDSLSPEVSPIDKIREAVLPKLKNKLSAQVYDILPVTAKWLEGVLLLDQQDWELLRRLAASGKVRLRSRDRFVNRDVADSTREQRQALADKIELYGIYRLITLLRAEMQKPEDERLDEEGIMDYVVQESGIQTVEKVIIEHFGNRAFLVKSMAAIERMKKAMNRARYGASRDNEQIRQVCNQVQSELNKVLQNSFYLLHDWLRQFYEGRLNFGSEENDRQFLYIIGEYGNDYPTRLGLPVTAGIYDLNGAVQQRIQIWSALVEDFSLSFRAREAARTVLDVLYEMAIKIQDLCAY